MGSVDKVITVHGILEAVNKGIVTIHPGPLRAALESLNEYHLLGLVSNPVKMGTYCSVGTVEENGSRSNTNGWA